MTQIIDTLLSQPVTAAPQSTGAANVFASLLTSGTATGYAITADKPLIQAADASSTGFTFSGAEIGATYRYSITSDGGGAAVTGSGIVSAANQDVTGIDVSTLPDGTLTYRVILTDAKGAGNEATANARLDRSALPSAAAADSVFGQQSWLQP